MVTTRSADKRLDASRGEDLVLRSRTIGSPNSVASTPSRAQKRTASARENSDSLHPKRVRTENSGNASSKTTHVVVNIPVISINRDNLHFPDALDKNSDPRAECKTTGDNHAESGEDGDQTTPNAKVTAAAETPDQGGESFQTPATSRHKRFDSEDPDNDTIIVSTVMDSSAPQGYHTAEEEIADTDDDEAPDIQSTKVAPKLPQRKSIRSTKGKKRAATTPNTIDVDEETIEVAPSQTGTESESLTLGKESPASEGGADDATSPTLPGRETLDTDSVPPTLVPVHVQMTIGSQSSINTTPPTLLSARVPPTRTYTEKSQTIPPPTNQEVGSAEDADAESVTVSDSTLQDLSLVERKTPSQVKSISSEISGPVHNNFFPHILSRSTQLRPRKSNLAPVSETVRLPAKATSGLSDYRHRKFQQKVAGSAGGLRTQADWPKKRSSFVVS